MAESRNVESNSVIERQRTPLSFIEKQEALRKLKSEAVRLRTFRDWVHDYISPKELAKYGFFYYHTSDHVQCAFCLGIVGKWVRGDDVGEEHARHFPRCPFVLGLPVGNNAIDGENIKKFPEVKKEREDGPDHTIVVNFGKYFNGKEACKAIGFTERKLTFKYYPEAIGICIDAVANAGFYYENITDQLTCFHCDGKLRRWRSEFDPWLEHKKWFPDCGFLKNMEALDMLKMDELTIKSFKCTWVNKLGKIEEHEEKEQQVEDECKEDIICKVCFSTKSEIAILPCGHVCVCRRCASGMTKCPLCRGRFAMMIPVYI